MLAAIDAGCRGQLTVCESLSCLPTESAEGGSGGESAGEPDLPVPHDTASGGDAEPGSGGVGAAGGEGGQPGLETCAERTQICPAASVCNDRPEGASCSYPPGLGMVAYVGNDIDGGASLVVVPLSPALPEPARLDWSAGAEKGKFVMPWRPSWAPNGQALTFYLTAADFLSDFSQRFYWVDLSLPAPLTPMRIPNIPVTDDFSSTLWSPNSRRLLVQQTAGVFVVDFADGRATTERVGEEGASLTELAFCADGSLVYNQDGLATIAPGLDQVPIELEQTVVSVAPGGRWLLLSDGTTDFVAACATGATPLSLQPASFGADWSANGDDLVLTDSDSEPVVRSVWHFEMDADPRLVQQVSTSARDVAWQPAGPRLLYQSWQNDAAGTFHVLDLTAEPVDRALPIAPELVGDDNAFEVSWVAQSSKVRWSYFDEDLERHDFLLDLAAEGDPVPLGSTTPDWFSSDGEQSLSIEQLDEGSQVWLSEVSNPTERQPLFPEPLPCYLLVKDLLPGAAPFLECTDADERTTLYAVADDLHSALQISDGTYVDDPVLRPRP
ncbi:MAG: hypothetical protein ABUL60_24235 [Myxococcales bacterium]